MNKVIKSKDFGQLHELDVWEDFAMHKITYRAQLLKNIQFRHTEGSPIQILNMFIIQSHLSLRSILPIFIYTNIL